MTPQDQPSLQNTPVAKNHRERVFVMGNLDHFEIWDFLAKRAQNMDALWVQSAIDAGLFKERHHFSSLDRFLDRLTDTFCRTTMMALAQDAVKPRKVEKWNQVWRQALDGVLNAATESFPSGTPIENMSAVETLAVWAHTACAMGDVEALKLVGKKCPDALTKFVPSRRLGLNTSDKEPVSSVPMWTAINASQLACVEELERVHEWSDALQSVRVQAGVTLYAFADIRNFDADEPTFLHVLKKAMQDPGLAKKPLEHMALNALENGPMRKHFSSFLDLGLYNNNPQAVFETALGNGFPEAIEAMTQPPNWQAFQTDRIVSLISNIDSAMDKGLIDVENAERAWLAMGNLAIQQGESASWFKVHSGVDTQDDDSPKTPQPMTWFMSMDREGSTALVSQWLGQGIDVASRPDPETESPLEWAQRMHPKFVPMLNAHLAQQHVSSLLNEISKAPRHATLR